ncbi:hypothetical protein SAMN03159343_3128 [Klenkia marina]|uniref:Uncharacterized protein n=1 Tax=Klenkia marina TaxID=1960309 RepID=A0A1G4YMH8_9ACTN|nr:hypothetical protein [Klenkia marina]SCX54702.1 hypothetical protein SAMN03159343_3128 [Klenkia marina]
MSWLQRAEVDASGIGYDPDGWPASVWVLHSMYEHRLITTGLTHDDVHRERLARGMQEPDMIGEVDLPELTVSGVPLGYEREPGPDWTRLRWRTLIERSGGWLDEEDPDWPSEVWLDQDWPASTIPPPEGSLDEVSWTALIDVLGRLSDDGQATRVVAYYDFLTARDWQGPNAHVLSGELGGITTLVDELGYLFSPSNWWAEDRSWFVYTDYDLNTTKVSGSVDLIKALGAESDLETIRWRGPGGRGARSYRQRIREGRPPNRRQD